MDMVSFARLPSRLKIYLPAPGDQSPRLRDVFESHCRPELLGASKNTLEKYQDALSLWSRITGDPPITEITREVLLVFQKRLTEEPSKITGKARSPATVNSVFRHLNAVLKYLWPADSHNPGGIGVVPFFGRPKKLKEAEKIPRVFSFAELDRLYEATIVATWPISEFSAAEFWRAAFVTHYNCGPRTFTDLFSWRWEHLSASNCGAFVAKKTGKIQRIPLNRVVLWHLDRIRVSHGFVWPGFTESNSSTVYRQWKKICAAAGVVGHLEDFRKTCNTAYENHRPGVGEWILGHSARGVNAKNYYDPTAAVLEAVATLPQPESFTSRIPAAQLQETKPPAARQLSFDF